MDEKTRILGPSNILPIAPQEACLVVIHADDRRLLGRKFALIADDITIGREASNAIVLESDDVSRHHARVFRREDRHVISDLRSTNGSYVNEQAIELQPLAAGDRIRIGSIVFKYLSGGDIESLYHEEIRRIALLDSLTGIHNQRFLLEFLEREIARCRRHARPLSLLFVDVDYFKQVNDLHGHLAGDAMLREIAKVVKPIVRVEECFARYGGEEFALVLPETPLGKALVMAEKIRSRIESHDFRYEGRHIPLTVSLGAAEMDAETTTPATFIGRADARLYEAKRSGRNRVA